MIATAGAAICVAQIGDVDKTAAAPPESKPVASRIGPIYGPVSSSNSKSILIDVVTDFIPASKGSEQPINLDQVRSSATLVCADCEKVRDAIPTQVRSFADTGEGITQVVAVEVGSGMAGERLASVKDTLLNIIKSKQTKDRVALVTVGSDLKTLADFSASDQDLQQAIQGLHAESEAYPRLYGDLIQAIQIFDQVDSSFPPRRRLLFVGTGRNKATGDQMAAGGFRDDNVIDHANAANVVIDAIGVPYPLPPKVVTLMSVLPKGQVPDSLLQEDVLPHGAGIADQKLMMPPDQSVDGYLEALEKIAQGTGGIYLQQDPKLSTIGDRMKEGVQWIKSTPVLTFDLNNVIPADNKSHRIVVRLSSQPGKELAGIVTMPPAPKLFSVSPGLTVFVVALLGFTALVIFNAGSKPKRRTNLSSRAVETSGSVTEEANTMPFTREAGGMGRGVTLREDNFGEGTRLKIPTPDRITNQGGASAFLEKPGFATQPERKQTRVLSSDFPEPRPGFPCCELRLIEGPSVAGRNQWPVLEKEVTIGRDPEMNNIALPEDPGISGRHITIRWNTGTVSVTDDRSTNGTRVNRAALQPGRPHPLEIGDEITIGSSTIRVEAARLKR